MSKSLIYTSTNAVQPLAVGATIDLGNVIRRFGPNIRLNGNAININGAGYYKISADIELTGTTEGTATISMLKDGVVEAIRRVSLTVGAIKNVPLQAVIREFGCCANNNSNITFVLGGVAESVTEMSVIVTKE